MRTKGPHVVKFIENYLTLGGSYLGQPFKLLPFQRDTIHDIYAVDESGKRIRRNYVLGLPRKNAKSQIGSALALYHLIIDRDDPAPLVISAAGDRAQARLVFSEAKRMVLASPELRHKCQVFANEIRCATTGGTYKVVSSDAGLSHGLNPSMVVVDELHVFKKADLLEGLTSGSAARRSPLFLVISTAGHDLEAPLGRLYRTGLDTDGHIVNGERRTGRVHDPSFGMTWWGPEYGAEFDHTDPDVWRRYNPAWPFLSEDDFASACRTIHESEFIRLRLNGWTSVQEAWLPAGAWQELEDSSADIDPRTPVVLGFDGSVRGDATALVAVTMDTPRVVKVLGLWQRPPMEPDWMVPRSEVIEQIRKAFRTYDVREMTSDPWLWQSELQDLANEGLPIVVFNTAHPSRMGPATAAFYEAVMNGELKHDGDPGLAQHIGNCVIAERQGQMVITKEHKSSSRKIDAAVAAVVAHQRALQLSGEPQSDEFKILVL